MHIKPILYISPLPPPNGGIATWTQKISQYGLPASHPFTIIDTRIRGKRNIFDDAKFSLREVWRNITIFFALIYHLLQKSPRLIHLNSSLSPLGIMRDLLCAFLAKWTRTPLIVHYHGNIPDFNRQRFYGLSGTLLNALMRLATMNIVTNEASLIHAQNNAQAKFIMLPNFIEDHIFAENKQTPQQLRGDREAPSLHYRALFAGGITRAKGCQELIAAAKDFPTIEFHLFGKMHADMASISLPTNVIMQGEIAHDTLISIMPDYHFLLFPSYTEGFPLTVLEAMAIGLPVIATSVGAITQMIDEGKGGFLCPPRDSKALVHAIASLTSEPQLLTTMGNYNRDKCFEQYRYSKVIKDLMQIYNQIEQSCVV